MSDYINREAAKESFVNMDAGSRAPCSTLLTPEGFAEYLDEIPAADVTEVWHGRLLRTGIDEYYGEFAECSVCGWDNMANAKYCSGCGAKMDLEGEN